MEEQSRPTNGSRFDWLFLAAIGLAVQALWMAISRQPSYMDAYYYAVAGQRLAEGHGFTVPVIWQYLEMPSGLPAPSHTYWMPLPSILAAAGYRLAGGYLGARILFWLLGGTIPVLAYGIARRLGGRRWQAWAAGLFAAAGGFYATFLGQTSTFAPFAWVAGGGLLAIARATTASTKREARWRWLIAGVAAGLAHLTRADGVLLLIVAAACTLWPGASGRRTVTEGGGQEDQGPDGERPARAVVTTGILWLLAGYLVVMTPWFVRNWSLFGRPIVGGGFHSVFLVTYDDLFAFGREATWRGFLDWGLGNILRSRLEGIWAAAQTMFAVPGLIFLSPFIIIAVWETYKHEEVKPLARPPFLFAVAIFLNSSLLFTYPGIRGTLFHASVALWPWTMALAPLGIDRSVRWVARRLSHWRPERASPTFSALFIVLAFLVSLFVGAPRLPSVQETERLVEISRRLPAKAIVMTGNAPAFYYHTGLASINVPNEPVDVVLQASDRYGVTHLLLDEGRPQPLEGLYSGREQDRRLRLIDVNGDLKLYEIVRTS